LPSSVSMVEAFNAFVLAMAAFWLGACPFSVWVGRWFLGKDIRDYGDGNPGAMNVFRAGGRKSYFLASILDVAKGVPFVFLAHSFWEFPEIVVVGVALSAILGHAFSPLLGFKGGKSIAVTFGVLFALPQYEILISFAIFLLIGFLFMEGDAWTVMFGAVGSLAYLVTTKGNSWESLFMLCVLAILAVKHFDSLKTMPRRKVRILAWIQSRRR
jgi:glycerol-3-phosphate acyltransferase PlsY